MKRTMIQDLYTKSNEDVIVKGSVVALRKMGGITFARVQDRTGEVQVVLHGDESPLKKYDRVSIEGRVLSEPNAYMGVEIKPHQMDLLARAADNNMPIAITPKSTEKLDNILKYRSLSLRNPNILDIFKVQSTVVQAFREYVVDQGFTEIFSPKIVPQGAEGGSNVFKFDYFGKTAFLAQSPQLYKQMMVGTGLERVFETGHAYRAEEHDTARHLNEYLSLDLEMGYIDSMHDIMDLEEEMMRHIFDRVQSKNGDILERRGVVIPQFTSIPRIPLDDLKEILASRYNKRIPEGKDIDPEGERLAADYAKQEFGSDLIFMTKYPVSVRPFYAMPSPDGVLTESFDMLLRGLEVTTGGQRIHQYEDMLSAMNKNGINPDNFEGYLQAYKYGMPPHGGLGIGAERLTARILDIANVKEASLFPRDKKRFSP